ncbi:MAG: DUF302 domain-containing protein [Rectinemataceae bacterium]|nr:DUF302 domain-containing protein [Rectinemataceae bacterium]
MKYYYKKQVSAPFSEAVEKTKAALAKEGFGVLTEIDVRATLKAKLDTEYDNYVILGACNPPLAHQALLAEKDIGLLLPCNVLVYEDVGNVFVSAIVPSVAMGFVNNEALTPIANEVDEKLKRVVDAV